MQLDQNPFFRKPITPWYDSNLVCWGVAGFAFLVFIFALQGIYVVSSEAQFQGHLWFPSSLAVLSFLVAFKVLLRLNARKKNL